MNIIYILKGTKQIRKLYIRMYHNKVDLIAFTGLQFTSNQWNQELQSVVDSPEQNEILAKLRLDVLSDFNKQFSCGGLIDKDWLNKAVNNSLNRPKGENKLKNELQNVYLSDFANWWLENHADSWKVSPREFMGSTLKGQYVKTAKLLAEYEKLTNEKWELRKISTDQINGFIEWMETEHYQVATIKRNVSRLKFFLRRSEEMDIKVSKSYTQRIYFGAENDFDGVYLTESEINQIVNKDFSFDQELDIAKQNFLILLHTGLRVGDLLKNLDISNVNNDVIKIKTRKTKQNIVVPLHNVVKDILRKNFNHLPPKMNLSDLNKHIKTICMVCNIDQDIEGKLFDSKKKRKVVGVYKKYQMISSHVSRRSFATIYKGKISDEAICSILGWKNDKMLEVYNKTSKVEYAETLKEYWAKG